MTRSSAVEALASLSWASDEAVSLARCECEWVCECDECECECEFAGGCAPGGGKSEWREPEGRGDDDELARAGCDHGARLIVRREGERERVECEFR